MDEPRFSRGVRLGVDVGLARVGVAACDPDGILATPVRTLRRDAKKNSDIAFLAREAAERNAVAVFVGLPRTLKGAERSSAEMARDYARKLATALAVQGLDVQVRLVDERLTTVTAHQVLHAAGVGSRDHRKVVDQAAAVAILQHALDMEKARGTDVGELVPARIRTHAGRTTGERTTDTDTPGTETPGTETPGTDTPGTETIGAVGDAGPAQRKEEPVISTPEPDAAADARPAQQSAGAPARASERRPQ